MIEPNRKPLPARSLPNDLIDIHGDLRLGFGVEYLNRQTRTTWADVEILVRQPGIVRNEIDCLYEQVCSLGQVYPVVVRVPAAVSILPGNRESTLRKGSRLSPMVLPGSMTAWAWIL